MVAASDLAAPWPADAALADPAVLDALWREYRAANAAFLELMPDHMAGDVSAAELEAPHARLDAARERVLDLPDGHGSLAARLLIEAEQDDPRGEGGATLIAAIALRQLRPHLTGALAEEVDVLLAGPTLACALYGGGRPSAWTHEAA